MSHNFRRLIPTTRPSRTHSRRVRSFRQCHHRRTSPWWICTCRSTVRLSTRHFWWPATWPTWRRCGASTGPTARCRSARTHSRCPCSSRTTTEVWCTSGANWFRTLTITRTGARWRSYRDTTEAVSNRRPRCPPCRGHTRGTRALWCGEVSKSRKAKNMRMNSWAHKERRPREIRWWCGSKGRWTLWSRPYCWRGCKGKCFFLFLFHTNTQKHI